MKSAVETLSPTRVRLTVEVPFEELRTSLDTAYREIAKQVTIPGFRKGRIPPQIIDQRVGREFVLEQAVNEALPQLYVSALQENDVEPLGQPEVDVTNFADGADLTFTAEVDVRPDVTLPEYKGIEVSVADSEVTDEEVEEQLTSLRERFGSLSTVERAAEEGDFLTIDLAASKDGQPIEDAQATGLSYKIGSASMLEGLDEAVTGKSAGESETWVSQLASGEYAGQDVDVTVVVDAVKEQKLPDLDDEFAQMASEFDTLDELRADVRERLVRQKRLQQAQEARDNVLEKLLEQVEVPVPEGAVTDEIQARREAIGHQLQHMGATEAQYLQSEGQTEEEFVADLDKRSREALRSQFVLDKVADTEELNVSEPELTQALLQRAQQAGVSPDEYIQQVVQNNYVPTLVREVRRGKALGFIVEQAVVTDASGNPVELSRLQADGTYAEEGSEEAEGAESAPAAEESAEAAQTEGEQGEGEKSES
ncbi:trigger factor [Actinopolymorpha cephalotaxi]|uniref:Trigger factor n=1 Tax=Actinopolymorpha cephalotaxi TaxID=504797 RepID=A0A1I3AEP1_9ACTN|nr:trigger factor [Actinopolymorpha cephalotaxi]NYH82096.1 trigger factor [Actinopolymorpha cephalotaxi]SFH48488.1 trigger factor [Actinopolymorpha cephalotaxi]